MDKGEFPSIQRASQITREYLERIQANLQRGHGFDAAPFPGMGQSDDKGEQFGPDDFEYLDVELTGELSGSAGAYGWKAIIWKAAGEYDIWSHSAGGDPVLQGGKDATLGLIQPAYEGNRVSGIAAGKTARIYRAYRNKGTTAGNYPGQEWVFWSSGSGAASHPVGCTCCCCCVICPAGLMVHIPAMTLWRCSPDPEDPIVIPAFNVILVGSGDGCYVCGDPNEPMLVDPPTGLTFTGDIRVCCDPNDHRRCPVFQMRGTFNLDDESYTVCIGPVDAGHATGACHPLNPGEVINGFDGGEFGVAWAATVDPAVINDCDPANWECPTCFVTIDDPVTMTCHCGIICPRTGIPGSFGVLIHSGYTPLNNTSGTMGYGATWPFSDWMPSPFTDYACGGYWLASGSLGNGCRWFVAWTCTDTEMLAPVIGLIPPLGGTTSTPCYVEALAFFSIHQEFNPLGIASQSCTPFCVIYRRVNPGGGFGGGALCFGDCDPCPEADVLGPPPPPPPPPDPPRLFLHPLVAFADEAGEIPADDTYMVDASEVATGPVIKLLVEPGDDPQAPASRYASGSSNTPTLYTDADAQNWIGGLGTNIKLDLSSSIVVDLAAVDLTIAVLISRPATNTDVVPIGGSGAGNPGAWIDASNTVRFASDTDQVSGSYTGSTGYVLAIWTIETREVFFQSTGMAKTSLGTLAPTSPHEVTLTHLLARIAAPLWTHANNRLGPILVFEGLYDAGDFADAFEAGGWFDNSYGVSV